MFDDDGFGALEAGAAYALLRHGQDTQTRQILAGLPRHDDDPVDKEVHVHVHAGEDESSAPPAINALLFSTLPMPESWDDYVGQGPLKQRMAVHIAAAKEEGVRLPHTLFASAFPGVGKTTAGYLTAESMGVKMFKLVPPFNVYTLVEAALTLDDHDVLFLDEIHKLADNGKRGAEFLLTILEDGVAYLDGEAVTLPDITIVGATTDRDKLPRTVVDRFKIKPYFQAYAMDELGRIAARFTWAHDALAFIDADLCGSMALACQGTPRILDEFVLGAKALALAFKKPPTSEEFLAFMEVEPDGMTRDHIEYITSVLKFYPRERKGGGTEFVVGEATMMQKLRQSKQGIGEIERFLVDRGLIDRTPRGRKLTSKGIEMAMRFIVQGKGAVSVQ